MTPVEPEHTTTDLGDPFVFWLDFLIFLLFEYFETLE
jgi:hypothetical protein